MQLPRLTKDLEHSESESWQFVYQRNFTGSTSFFGLKALCKLHLILLNQDSGSILNWFVSMFLKGWEVKGEKTSKMVNQNHW